MDPTDENRVELNRDFSPREYQLDLFEKASSRNSIIFLPTGSGKTFIAALLIKHYAKDVLIKFTDGGKRIFFLVNSVPLVHQQAESIRKLLPLRVKEYAGYMKVDFWNKEKWFSELDEAQVLVMTAQIFLNLICHGYLKLTYVALIIFDECHHARQNHAMKQIMEQFKGYMDLPDSQLPRICGLTAALLLGNCKPSSVLSEIRSLEVTLMSNVITAINSEMVQLFSTNPQISCIAYNNMINSQYDAAVERWVTESCSDMTLIELKEYENITVIGELVTDLSKDVRKQMKKGFMSFKALLANLGVYGTFIGAFIKTIRCYKAKSSAKGREQIILDLAITQLHKLRHILLNFMSGDKDKWYIQFSSPKLRMLLEWAKRLPKNSSTVVFVEQRITAQVIARIFQDLLKTGSYENILQPDFMVGFSGNPAIFDRTSSLENKKNLDVLQKFNSGESNFIVASSVIEEGIDVRICDHVIKFDFPKTYRSYIQSKGRARHAQSKFILFVEDGVQDNQLLSFMELERYVKNQMVCSTANEIKREELEETLFNAELPPYYTLGKTGPCVTALSAIQLINRYSNTLPHDSFTRSVPYWSKKTEDINGEKKICVFLQLPLNSPVKIPLQGPWCSTFELAKRAVALAMCKKLHQLGELNDNLLPYGKVLKLDCQRDIFPYWDHDDTSHPALIGTNKIIRQCAKLSPSLFRKTSCSSYYLHIIKIEPRHQEDIEDGNVFRKILRFPYNFGLITTQKLPPVSGVIFTMNFTILCRRMNSNLPRSKCVSWKP